MAFYTLSHIFVIYSSLIGINNALLITAAIVRAYTKKVSSKYVNSFKSGRYPFRRQTCKTAYRPWQVGSTASQKSTNPLKTHPLAIKAADASKACIVQDSVKIAL